MRGEKERKREGRKGGGSAWRTISRQFLLLLEPTSEMRAAAALDRVSTRSPMGRVVLLQGEFGGRGPGLG